MRKIICLAVGCILQSCIFAGSVSQNELKFGYDMITDHNYEEALIAFESVVESMETQLDDPSEVNTAIKASLNAAVISANLGDREKAEKYNAYIGEISQRYFNHPLKIRVRRLENGLIIEKAVVKKASFQPFNYSWGAIYVCNSCGSMYSSQPSSCSSCGGTSFTVVDLYPDKQ